MKNYIGNFTINIKCPNCHGELKVPSNQVGSSITCRFCHQSIELADKGFSKGVNDVNKQLDKLQKDLKKIFK